MAAPKEPLDAPLPGVVGDSPAMRAVLRRLEPFALDLWGTELAAYVPQDVMLASVHKRTYFGGLYQKVVLTR